jgi:hypothetical protein
MKRLCFVTACLILCAVSQALAADSRPVKELYVWPVVCKCEDNGMHGDIYLTFGASESRQVTWDGMNAFPKMTSDGKLVGWLHGRHHDIWGIDEQSFLPNELVIWRGGSIYRRIPGESGDILGWQFWNNGTQVAVGVGDRRTHPNSYFLYDLDTLRKIGVAKYWKHPGSDIQPPAWAEGIENVQGKGCFDHPSD